ncbi:hypothetical protein BST95_09295 [Halioglobus japonicus]|nr:hypothetical protein BST95_09295 [Halioglobus japonicus]
MVTLVISQELLSMSRQTGMVLLVGVASKTVIMIVEFGKQLREAEQMDLLEATVEAIKLHFRPVMMTGLSFVVGAYPLTDCIRGRRCQSHLAGACRIWWRHHGCYWWHDSRAGIFQIVPGPARSD